MGSFHTISCSCALAADGSCPGCLTHPWKQVVYLTDTLRTFFSSLNLMRQDQYWWKWHRYMTLT